MAQLLNILVRGDVANAVKGDIIVCATNQHDEQEGKEPSATTGALALGSNLGCGLYGLYLLLCLCRGVICRGRLFLYELLRGSIGFGHIGNHLFDYGLFSYDFRSYGFGSLLGYGLGGLFNDCLNNLFNNSLYLRPGSFLHYLFSRFSGYGFFGYRLKGCFLGQLLVGVTFVELGGFKVGEGAVDELFHATVGSERHFGVALNGDTLAGVHVDTATVVHIHELEGTQALDFHQMVRVETLLYGGHKSAYEAIGGLLVKSASDGQFLGNVCQCNLSHGSGYSALNFSFSTPLCLNASTSLGGMR